MADADAGLHRVFEDASTERVRGTVEAIVAWATANAPLALLLLLVLLWRRYAPAGSLRWCCCLARGLATKVFVGGGRGEFRLAGFGLRQ